MKEREEKRQKQHKLQKFWNAVLAELRENKNTFIVYGLLRLLVLGVLILQIFNRNYQNVFLCLLTLVLMIVPSMIQVTFHVEIPSFFEIIILVFIFAAEILGEISAFYIKFPYWDTVLHTLNGFLCAAVGFSLVDLMNRERRLRFELSPLFTAIIAFCFSMTIGVLWEFFEFGMDQIWGLDMQKDTVIYAISSTYLDPLKDNNCVTIPGIQEVLVNGESLGVGGYLDIGLIDTMWDMIVNFIGAFVFSTMGYFYEKRRENKGLVKELVLEPWSEEKSAGAEEERR